MDPLTIALAIYGGYQGYSSAKRAHANTLGQLFATAAGAYGGYNLGEGIGGLMSAGEPVATNIGVGSTINEGVRAGIGTLYDVNAVDPYATTSLGMNAALPETSKLINVPSGIQTISTGPQFQQLEPTIINAGYEQPIPQGVRTLSDTGELSYQPAYQPSVQQVEYKGEVPTMDEVNRKQALSDKLAAEQERARVIAEQQRIARAPYNLSGIDDEGQVGRTVDYYTSPIPEKSLSDKALEVAKKTFTTPEGGINVGNTALVGVPAALYLSGAFERKPFERNLFTYNVNYPDLYRSRTFQAQDPRTGQIYNLPQQTYIPEERAKASITDPSKQQFGPYKREVITLNKGGIASLSHFKDGGVSYLPTKSNNDETNENNYMRVNGYIEDATGTADKNEDTMLAQLADGEFVTRTDGVLGAGILAGANPNDEKQMRKMGADFFYEQQKRFKRIFDLLDASRKATAH